MAHAKVSSLFPALLAIVLCLGRVTAQAAAYKRDLFGLCTEAMAGRATGTAGDDQAIVRVAEGMQAAGLKPGNAGAFRQEFMIANPAPAVALPGTACRFTQGGTARALRPSDFQPFGFSADGDVDAAVVYAGHGLVIPDLDIDDYADLAVRGRIVLVLRGGPDWNDPKAPVQAHRAELTFRAKAARAQERGAAALLLVDRDDGRSEAETETALRVSGNPSGIPCLWVRRQAAAGLFRSGIAGLRAAQAAADEGRAPRRCDELRAGASAMLRVRLAPRAAEVATANVIGMLAGSRRDDRHGEYVVIAAHHDHLGRGDFGSLARPEDIGRIHPGADDDASGVAGMLELARRFQRGQPTARTLVFVAFGAQELGQLGSRRFLEDGPVPAERIAAMLELQMIGRARSGHPALCGVGTGAGLKEMAEAAAVAAKLEAQIRPCCSVCSDQATFVARGIPALLLTTGLHDQYRRPSDVPELVEIDGAMQVLDLAEALVRALADAEAPAPFQPPRK
jgi:hypothetical protein